MTTDTGAHLVKIRDLLNSAAQSDDLKQCRALVKQALAEAIAALQPGGEREEAAQWLEQLADNRVPLNDGSGMLYQPDEDTRNALLHIAALLRAPVAVSVDDLNLLHAGDMSPAEQMAFADKLEAALAGEVR